MVLVVFALLSLEVFFIGSWKGEKKKDNKALSDRMIFLGFCDN